MPTSLSLLHTLALSASFTLQPNAISAFFLPSLLLHFSWLAAHFIHLLSADNVSPLVLRSLLQVLHWSAVRSGGSVSYHPRYRSHHHSRGAGPGTWALAQHYSHRHSERSEAPLCTTLNIDALLQLAHWIISFIGACFQGNQHFPPLTPASTDE